MKSRILFIDKEQLLNHDLFEEYDVRGKEEIDFGIELNKMFYMLLKLEGYYINSVNELVKRFGEEELIVRQNKQKLNKDMGRICDSEGISEEFIRALAVLFVAKSYGRENEKVIAKGIVNEEITNKNIQKIVECYVNMLHAEREQLLLRSKYGKIRQKEIATANIIEAYRKTIAFNPKYINMKDDDIEKRVVTFKNAITEIYDNLFNKKINEMDAIKATEDAISNLNFSMKYVEKKTKTDNTSENFDISVVNIKDIIYITKKMINDIIDKIQGINEYFDEEFNLELEGYVRESFKKEKISNDTMKKICEIIDKYGRYNYIENYDDIQYLEFSILEELDKNKDKDKDYTELVEKLCKKLKDLLQIEDEYKGKNISKLDVYKKDMINILTQGVDKLKEYLKVYYDSNKGIINKLDKILNRFNICELDEFSEVIIELKGILESIDYEYAKNFEEENVLTDTKSIINVKRTKKFLMEQYNFETDEKKQKDAIDELYGEKVDELFRDSLSDYCTMEYVKGIFKIRRTQIAKIKKDNTECKENRFYISRLNPDIAIMTYKFYGSNIDKYDMACIVLDKEDISKVYIVNSTMSWNGKANRINEETKDGVKKYYNGEYLFTMKNTETLMHRIYGNDEKSSGVKESKTLADNFMRKGPLYDYRKCMIQPAQEGKVNYKKEYLKMALITPESEQDIVGNYSEIDKKSVVYLSETSDIIKFFMDM